MSTKLAFQFQRIPSWAKDVVLAAQAAWCLLIEAPEKDPFEGQVNILARAPLPGGDSEELRYILKGRKGAEEYFERLAGTYDARRYVTVWQGPNEPPVGEHTFRLMLVEFTIRWTELMHENGFQNGVGAFSVGWPHIDPSHVAELAPMFQKANYIIAHEYSAPTMMDRAGSHCLRYRWLYDTIKEVSRFEPPPLLLGEVGIDGGVAPIHKAETGWKTYCKGNFEQYVPQLQWFDEEIQKDIYVTAAFIFVAGARKKWIDFDLDESNARKLAEYMLSIHTQDTGPLPEHEQGDLIHLLDKLRWWLEEMQRMYEQGNLERANEIRLSLIKLSYRISKNAQEGSWWH